MVVVAAMMGGCEGARSKSAITAPTIRVGQIPIEWKLVEAGPFVVALPPEMKEIKLQGIDTAIWQYDGNNLSFFIEIGFLGGDFSFDRSRYESSVESVMVNGLKAERLLLDLNKPILKNWSFNADGSTKVPVEKRHLVTEIFFPDMDAKFSVHRTPDVSADKADAILDSIKFKK